MTSQTLRIPPLPVRVATAVSSLAKLVRDPNRLDQVFVLGVTLNLGAVARGLERISDDPESVAMLEQQPRIDVSSVDFDALERLPDGTLGREYQRFLKANGITPKAFEALPDVGDPRAAYVILRVRQTHDLWHLLTGYPPDPRGEILLQAFTYAQLGAPSALLIAAVGAFRWAWGWQGELAALRGAYQRGKQARFLLTFRWEEHWATPVTQLRELLGCPQA